METLVKKGSQNGTTKTKTVAKDKAISNGSTTATVEKPTVEEKKETAPQFTLEERIQRVEQLRGLTLKRKKTVDTLNELKTFVFSSDDNSQLEITDGSHRRFVTCNSNLITLLNNHLEMLLLSKVKELDTKIIDFQI